MAKVGMRIAEECRLAATYTGVALLGFAVDAALLHLLLLAGVAAAWGRVFSLAAAMQVTFLINRHHVFPPPHTHSLVRQWWRYMLSNGFGNVCNYWIFVTLISLHWRVVSTPLVALAVSSFAAWMINFLAARYFVFAKVQAAIERAGDRYARPE